MISIIKEICIFMIIAQAVLFFVPGNSYMKYVKILVGIIMIMRITQPIFGMVSSDETKQEMQDRITELGKNIETAQNGVKIEGDNMGIYSSIEEELKNRLNKSEVDYEVEEVELVSVSKTGEVSTEVTNDMDGDMQIVITVSAKKGETQYASSASMETGKIEIELIKVTDSKKEKKDSSVDEKLKQVFGSCIGVDTGSIETKYK